MEFPGYTEELYYDRTRNRRRVSAGVEESYKYGPANHLTEYTKGGVKTTFTYDNVGNLTADDRARYTYDLFNRTEKVETFDGHVQVNRYDAENLRHEMEEDGKLVQFIFRGQEVVMEENGDNKIRHIRGYELIASDAESARTYYHYASDEMGSITHVAEGKDVLNRYDYDAWGNLTLCEETVENRFKFNGQQYDPISQQYYLRARYYNPVIARFTQEDTYRGDGLNLYAYCRNNPVYYTDPSGHSCDKDANDRHPNDGQERGVPLLPAPEPILALPGPVMEPPIINPMQEMQRAQQLRELSAPEPVLALSGPVLDNYVNRTSGPDVEEPNNNRRDSDSEENAEVIGRLEYIHYEKPNKVTDVAELRMQVQGQIDGFNRIIAEEGMRGLKDRINNYGPEVEAEGRRYIKTLDPAPPGQVHTHVPDMKVGGAPTDVKGTEVSQNNSIIGGQANRIAREILNMSDNTTKIEETLTIIQGGKK